MRKARWAGGLRKKGSNMSFDNVNKTSMLRSWILAHPASEHSCVSPCPSLPCALARALRSLVRLLCAALLACSWVGHQLCVMSCELLRKSCRDLLLCFVQCLHCSCSHCTIRACAARSVHQLPDSCTGCPIRATFARMHNLVICASSALSRCLQPCCAARAVCTRSRSSLWVTLQHKALHLSRSAGFRRNPVHCCALA